MADDARQAALACVREILGADSVRTDPTTLEEFGHDMTENPGALSDAVLTVSNLESLQKVVRIAAEHRVPLVPRVAGTNLGGLAIPEKGGFILDLRTMNRIVEINADDMVAVVEPGVTFGDLARALAEVKPRLTIAFPLSPPETSVLANCLLDGLGNLSLRHGSMADWIAGLELVRADGSIARTGAFALMVPVPFGRAPLPDLTGLFVSFQGTTGIVSKLAVHLWPEPAYRERSFVLAYDRKATFRALRDLPRLDVLSDLGGLSWPTSKMLFGVQHPREHDPAEPEFFFYMDMGASTRELLDAKRQVLHRYLAELRRDGLRIEDPIDVETLVAVEPRLGRLSSFPTRLDFLLDHPDRGLTWVGTYGPLSRFEPACEEGIAILERHGFPPTIVARPMKGGHFAVLRFIEVFRRDDPAEVARVQACNAELCDALLQHGFVLYKTPGWAVARYRERLDPGFVRLLGEVKRLLDPDGILNPGRWDLG
jgi:glycolate oxidase